MKVLSCRRVGKASEVLVIGAMLFQAKNRSVQPTPTGAQLHQRLHPAGIRNRARWTASSNGASLLPVW